MSKVSFLVDGFNLYHSIRDASKGVTGTAKWLNLHSLFSSYLHLFGRDATLASIYYFSALATHLEPTQPDVTNRHRIYLRALRDTGVVVELAKFKPKLVYCSNCKTHHKAYEEKETDVAIGARLLELLSTDQCDTVVIVSGDTDILPAATTATRLYPHQKISFAFPFNRKNKELAKLHPGSFSMGKQQYFKNQFPAIYVLKDGHTILKPPSW